MSRDTGFGSATDFLQDPGKCLHPGSRPLCPMGSKYHPNPSFTQQIPPKSQLHTANITQIPASHSAQGLTQEVSQPPRS